MDTATTVPRAIHRLCFSPMRQRKTPLNRSSDTAEAAVSSWESAVDMVAAKMPARMSPARMARTRPLPLRMWAMATMMVSLSEVLT